MPRILVIEDDPAVRRGLVDTLGFAGYEVLEASTALAGRSLALDAAFDLALLDLVLPDGDGLAILAALRRHRPVVPVIVLTALGDERDRIAGLKGGADDYVVKPFSFEELLARVEAVLRRSAPGTPPAVRIVTACCTVHLDRAEIEFPDGQRTSLSEREVEILRYLAANPARVVTREELLTHVWQLDPQGLQTRTVDMHIARIREKIKDGEPPTVICTVRGRGYLLRAGNQAEAPAARAP